MEARLVFFELLVHIIILQERFAILVDRSVRRDTFATESVRVATRLLILGVIRTIDVNIRAITIRNRGRVVVVLEDAVLQMPVVAVEVVGGRRVGNGHRTAGRFILLGPHLVVGAHIPHFFDATNSAGKEKRRALHRSFRRVGIVSSLVRTVARGIAILPEKIRHL